MPHERPGRKGKTGIFQILAKESNTVLNSINVLLFCKLTELLSFFNGISLHFKLTFYPMDDVMLSYLKNKTILAMRANLMTPSPRE